MESKIFHGNNEVVEQDLNKFLRSRSIKVKNVEMSTCKSYSNSLPTIVTVLVLYERSWTGYVSRR